MISKKDSYAIFTNVVFFAFLITASGMLKADDIKETAKDTFNQVKEKSQELAQKLADELEYQSCSAQCYQHVSKGTELKKFLCFQRCNAIFYKNKLKRKTENFRRNIREFVEKAKSK